MPSDITYKKDEPKIKKQADAEKAAMALKEQREKKGEAYKDEIKGNLRQKRKDYRQKMDDERISSAADNILSRKGINLDEPTTPWTKADRKRTDEGVLKSVTDKEVGQMLEGFDKAYPDPTFKTQTDISKEDIEKSLRRQKGAKWWSVLRAAGSAYLGDPVNSNDLLVNKIKNERNQELQEYKDIADSNRKVAATWQMNYLGDKLAFLKERMADKNLSTERQRAYELEKEKTEAQLNYWKSQTAASNKRAEAALTNAESAKIKADKYNTGRTSKDDEIIYTKKLGDGKWQMTNQEGPYTDLLGRLGGNTEQVINEMATQAGADANKKNKEDYANQLLSRMFDIDVVDGVQVAKLKEGAGGFIRQLSTMVAKKKDLERKIEELKDQKYEERNSVRWGKDKIDAKYDAKIQEAQNNLQQTETRFSELTGGITGNTNNSGSGSNTDQEAGSVFDRFTQ